MHVHVQENLNWNFFWAASCAADSLDLRAYDWFGLYCAGSEL